MRAIPVMHMVVLLVSAPASRALIAQELTQSADSSAAVAAARSWLGLLDSARFSVSLDSAAPLLREMAGPADRWQQFVTMARQRYPVSTDRVVVGWEPAFSAEAAPPGRYVRVGFASRSGPSNRETVVLVLTPTGWRVAMYGLSGG